MFKPQHLQEMGSTLVSSPLIVQQQQTDDLTLLQTLSSALNQQRSKVSEVSPLPSIYIVL